MSVDLRPGTPFGAEITGVAGGDLTDPAAAEQCLAAPAEYGVVVYRELDIADEDLVTFTRLLGEPVASRTGEHRLAEIETIDGATLEVPQRATLLSAREVDDAGGDTEFANTYLAYRELPAEEQRRLAGLQVKHSFAAAQLLANPEPTADERAAWARVPTRVHPLVWTRRDGRKSLLLGATAVEVIGLPAGESRALLDRLLDWSTGARFTYRHQWRRGDLVIWDNTGMLHRASPFEPTSRRLLHRTTRAGVEAVA